MSLIASLENSASLIVTSLVWYTSSQESNHERSAISAMKELDAESKMSDHDTSPATAASKVFAIPELLERIIIRIPQHESSRIHVGNLEADRQNHLQQIQPILRAQRVNKTFHNTITGSRACMSAIFRKHAFTEAVGVENGIARFNPVLLGALKLECAEHEAVFKGSRLHYIISVRYEHFAQLESELKRIEVQGAGGGTWQDAVVCNTPGWLWFCVKVASGEIRAAYSGRMRPSGTIREAVQLFVDEVRRPMRLFEQSSWCSKEAEAGKG